MHPKEILIMSDNRWVNKRQKASNNSYKKESSIVVNTDRMKRKSCLNGNTGKKFGNDINGPTY